ncbi:MAG: hypothetical protein IKH34_04740 [Oscillospiraceae bacterium]|nr:hypothetical protein [Oscillospiraceae bacterium]
MEETKRRLYVEPSGFWTEAAVLFMILAMVFRAIGSIGRWDDMNYLITLVALPVFCGLLFLLSLLCFGKRAFWTSVIPVVIGVVFFIFQIMAVEDNLVKVGLISLCVVIAVLYAMTFSHPALKWLLALVLLGVFGYLLGMKDLPKLLDPNVPVDFLEGMQEMSVLGILLSLLCTSLAMKMSRKTQEEPAKEEEKTPETPPAVPEKTSSEPIVPPAPTSSPVVPTAPAPTETAAPKEPSEPPAGPSEPTEPAAPSGKKPSWRERRRQNREKKEPQPPAKKEEELFPFPIPEPTPDPVLPTEEEEPFPPTGGSTWQVSYEEPAAEPPASELYPEPDEYPNPGFFPEPDDYPDLNAFPEPDDYPDPSAFPEPDEYPDPDFFPEPDSEHAPEPAEDDDSFCPPPPDFGEDAEDEFPLSVDFTPVEEVPITKKTPFAEPAEIYPLEEPAADEPGPTDL